VEQKQEIFSTILSIDPYQNLYVKGASGELSFDATPEFSKKQYTISYLNSKSFISTIISISKNIPLEDLHDVIENKTYEELALDMAISYHINYIEIANKIDENNRFYHVFVVDPLTIENDFENAIEKVKYIDTLLPVPLLFKTLYTEEIIDDNGLHCFIYFQQSDAFLTLYNEQEFLYTKSLNFSLEVMHQNFCELLGEQVSYEVFIEILSSNEAQKPEHQTYIIRLLSDIFVHINDILTYAKRAFEIDTIDMIYIDCELVGFLGLDEYAQTYLSIAAHDLNFDFHYINREPSISQIHSLMQLYSTLSVENRYECNFSIFHRPPPFVKRESGKFILLTAASLIIALAYPVTNWTLASIENMRYTSLKNDYGTVHNKRIMRQATIHLKEKNKQKIQKIEQLEVENYNNTKKTLLKIHDIKVNYIMKTKNLAILTKMLNRYNVKLQQIDYDQNASDRYFMFTLLSNSNHKITELVEDLTKTQAGHYSFSLHDIDYYPKEKQYVSKLKVGVL
jgi:hypothetical protein